MKVLFADDDSSILEQAKIFLEDEEECFDVETVSSADKGLELLEEENFDAVVSDYQMSGMDGLEFLEVLREDRDSDIPFILFTGKGREEVAMKALNLGADRYLEKGGDPRSQYGVLADAILQEVHHRMSEKDMQESEERYRRLFETAQDGMIILDAGSGKIKDANPYIQDLTGYSKEELVGKELWQIGTFENVVENKKRFDELVEEGFIRYKDLPLESKGGDEKTVEFVSNTYQAGGHKVVQCNIRDVSKRKEKEEELRKSERKFRKSFEAFPDPAFLLDEDGVFVDVNKSALKKLGFDKGEIVGSSLWDNPIFPEETIEKTTENFERRKNGEDVPPYTVELEGEDGERMIVEINVGKFEEDGFEGEIVIAHDITEQEKKEEELRKERKRFLEIFNNANDAIYVHELDEEGMPSKFIEVNDVACEMLGYSREELLEMSPKDIDTSEKADEVPEVMEELLEEGEVNFEMCHGAKDGTEIPVEVNSHLFELEGEKRIISVARDITERKKAEEELRREKERAQRYLEAAEVMMISINSQGEVIQANRKASEVLGYDKKKIIGKNWFENFVPEDQREEVQDVHEKFGKGKYPEYHENSVLTKSGEVRTILWHNSTLRDEEGNVTGTLSSGVDITERKEAEEELRGSEERYRELFESVGVAIIVHGPGGEIRSVNPFAEKALGLKEEELKEKDLEYWEGKFYNQNREQMGVDDLPISKAVHSGQPVEEQVFGISVEDKREIEWYILTAVPHFDGDGEIKRVIVSFKDITKQKRLQDRKDFLNTLLRQDLKNKYQVIHGYYELLDEEADISEEYKEYLKMSMEASRKADELLGLVKKLEKIEGSEVTGEKDIVKVLEFVVDTVSDLDKEGELDIEEDYSESISKVEGDYSLYTLFTQLLMTRIRIGESSKIKISVKEGENGILVEIEDNGKHLTEDVKDLLERRIYKADTSGIGGVRYYIAGEIARHNNSKIEVRDSEMDGVKFYMKFRRA